MKPIKDSVFLDIMFFLMQITFVSAVGFGLYLIANQLWNLIE